MTGVTVRGISLLGAEPRCVSCGAGATVAFNWEYARESGSQAGPNRAGTIAFWQELRRGFLYKCEACGEAWHLNAARSWMSHVGPDRLPLVLEWNRAPIELRDELRHKLTQIGPTPPDVYGNWRERRVTPCMIRTISGEEFPSAMVCMQMDAPVQRSMDFRLGSEIAEILESPSALPLDVRVASSRAHEMRMGFSPSLIRMPDGKKFVLNGMTSFMDEPGYRAMDAMPFDGSYFNEDPTPAFLREAPVTYFVVDGDPGWMSELPERVTDTGLVARFKKLFRQLSG